MAKLRINGDSSGYVDLSAPNAASSSTLDLDQVPQKNAAATTFTGNLGLGAAPNIGSSSGTAILTLTNSGTNRAVLEMGSTTAMSGGVYAQESYYNGGVLSTLTQHGAEGANSGYTKFFTKASSGSVTEKMRIHGAGYVTTPQQPCFSCYKNGTQAEQTGVVAVTSWHENFDTGSNLNAATGRFTAPVAGKYFFCFSAMHSGTVSGDLQHRIFKNGAYYQGSNDTAGGGSWDQNTIVTMMDMAQGDYAEPHVYSSQTSSKEVVYNDKYSGWHGYLIG